MDREMIEELRIWRDSKQRKPLILAGARQVGKTWLMIELGKKCYQNYVYFNFDENNDLDQIFLETKATNRIIDLLALVAGEKIVPQETLIIFDEIQESPAALNSLKYFAEQAQDYHLIAAGSLLGVTLANNRGFPVGKVEIKYLTPLSFLEFLRAIDEAELVNYLVSKKDLTKVPEIIHHRLIERLQQYYLIGGMPEVVVAWKTNKDLSEVRHLQEMILESYRLDFSKHTTKSEQNKLTLVWNSLPAQLIKENKRFIYGMIRKGARAKDYEFSLQWIKNAGLIQVINLNCAHGVPLKVYDDPNTFKTYLLDVGLLTAMVGVEGIILLQSAKILSDFNGGLTENFISNQLYHGWAVPPKYWTNDHPKAKVDFLIQYQNHLFPIEVKASTNIRSLSLKKYADLKKPLLKIRFSLNNLTLDDNLLNLPLYLVNETKTLLEVALQQLFGIEWWKK